MAIGHVILLNDQIEEAIKAGDEAVAQGFKFNKLQQFAWYIQYYEDQKITLKSRRFWSRQ